MVGYNLTKIVADNGTTVLGFVQGVNNELTLGWFGLLFIIGVCVVLYTSFIFKGFDPARSLSATSFIAFILILILTAAGLVNNGLALFIALVAAGATIAFTWRPRN